MTRAREWPNVQRQRRDKAAWLLKKAEGELIPLITQRVLFDKTETLRRQASVLVYIQQALALLCEAGADTDRGGVV